MDRSCYDSYRYFLFVAFMACFRNRILFLPSVFETYKEKIRIKQSCEVLRADLSGGYPNRFAEIKIILD